MGADLEGVQGFTGRGAVEYVKWRSGARALDVALKGVAGLRADVYADDKLAATVSLDNGKGGRKFSTRRGDQVPELGDGARIEIRQNGDPILIGVLTS
ncbi:MAG: hypothetical protein AAGC77_04410 [Pseudomonadota bacterium]